MDNETKERLHRLWLTLCHRLSEVADKPIYGLADLWWQSLHSEYSDSKRAYHNWDHIDMCLAEFYKVRHLFIAPLAAELAIWFHDCIYDVPQQELSNEYRSMQAACAFCSDLTLNANFIRRVEKYILATDHDPEKLSILDNDQKLLCSIDLAALSQRNFDYFDGYAWPIRQEYKDVPLEIYREKRAGVMRTFLERTFIYPAECFREREVQARANIAKEIELLACGKFPEA